MRTLLISSLIVTIAVGCGGITDGRALDDAAAAADAGPPAPSQPSGLTLDTVCSFLAPKICTISESCCVASGFGYDQSGCVSQARIQCEKNVAEVKAGTMKFEPSLVEDCLSQYQKLYQKCFSTLVDRMTMLDELKTCRMMFSGNRSQDASCDRSEQCAQSSDPNTYAYCDGTCTSFRFIAQGEACDYNSFKIDSRKFCRDGLYCKPLEKDGLWSGTCEPVTAVGNPCDTYDYFNFECGLGAYCDTNLLANNYDPTNVCTPSKAAGENCSGDIECQQLYCDEGRCKAPDSFATQKACTGM